MSAINTLYDSGLSTILHHDLHWLDITERIQFRVAATVYKCVHGMAPAYLTEHSDRTVFAHRYVNKSPWYASVSATTSNLVIPRCRLSTYGTRAFSVAGPVCWHVLNPDRPGLSHSAALFQLFSPPFSSFPQSPLPFLSLPSFHLPSPPRSGQYVLNN